MRVSPWVREEVGRGAAGSADVHPQRGAWIFDMDVPLAADAATTRSTAFIPSLTDAAYPFPSTITTTSTLPVPGAHGMGRGGRSMVWGVRRAAVGGGAARTSTGWMRGRGVGGVQERMAEALDAPPFTCATRPSISSTSPSLPSPRITTSATTLVTKSRWGSLSFSFLPPSTNTTTWGWASTAS